MLGEHIKSLRQERGLTQKQLANMLNIDRSTLSYYESEKSVPPLENLIKLAKIFNLSIDNLVQNPTVLIKPYDYNECEINHEKFYKLTESEREMVINFRRLDYKDQLEAIRNLSTLKRSPR